MKRIFLLSLYFIGVVIICRSQAWGAGPHGHGKGHASHAAGKAAAHAKGASHAPAALASHSSSKHAPTKAIHARIAPTRSNPKAHLARPANHGTPKGIAGLPAANSAKYKRAMAIAKSRGMTEAQALAAYSNYKKSHHKK